MIRNSRLAVYLAVTFLPMSMTLAQTTPPANNPPAPNVEAPVSAVDKALQCSDGFTLARKCEVVDGPQDYNRFSYCEKSVDANTTLPEIHVVEAEGEDVASQDQGDFTNVKNIVDSGEPSIEVDFNGQSTILSKTDVKIESRYKSYWFVPNNNFAVDKSWTHRLYTMSHSVVETYNSTTKKWTRVDVGLDIGDQNKPNRFLCYAN